MDKMQRWHALKRVLSERNPSEPVRESMEKNRDKTGEVESEYKENSSVKKIRTPISLRMRGLTSGEIVPEKDKAQRLAA